MTSSKLGMRYWCSRQDKTPGREQSHTQGYGQPRVKYGCGYCRAPLVTEAGQWVVYTRDPRTGAFDAEVAGGRFPGQAAANRLVEAKHDAEGYQPGFTARWVPAAAGGSEGRPHDDAAGAAAREDTHA